MLADYRGIDVGQTNGGRSDPGSPDWGTLRLTHRPDQAVIMSCSFCGYKICHTFLCTIIPKNFECKCKLLAPQAITDISVFVSYLIQADIATNSV